MTAALFDPGEPDPKPEKLSATRRLTIANNEMLARGVHPATRAPLLVEPEGLTCGDCCHAIRVDGMSRPVAGAWWKCARHRLGLSASAHSDIRKSWPACTQFASRVEQCDEFVPPPARTRERHRCDRCGHHQATHPIHPEEA